MKILLINLLCNLFLFQNCSKQNTTMPQEKYSYQVTATAPKEYPCEIHIGYLLDDKNEQICGIPKTGVLRSGWNNSGKSGAMGSDMIPSHINLTYVAYAEKKFYKLDAALPKEKILEAFRKGFLVKSKNSTRDKYELEKDTYNTFTIGIAPNGMIIIFLGGKNRIEICRLQAKETHVDRNDFYRNPHELSQAGFFEEGFTQIVPDSIQTQIKRSGIPIELYEDYRKKYNYRYVFKPYDENDRIILEYSTYFNGEENSIFDPKVFERNEYEMKGIPKNVIFSFNKYNAEINFNDQEILSVFDELQKKHPEKPLDILVMPTFMYKNIKLSVQCEDEIVPLKKYKILDIWGG